MLSRAPLNVVRNWVCDSRQWDGYKPREGDVIIATAPKAGTTWTQHIVNLLVFQSPAPRPLFDMSLWIDCRFTMPIEAMLPIIEAQQHRRFLKSHLPLDALPIYDEVRYIHVARAGLDACMSFLNHFNNYLPERWSASTRSAWRTKPSGGLSAGAANAARILPLLDDRRRGQRGDDKSRLLFDIECSFWRERARPNLLLVHYNDLKATFRTR